MKTTHATTFSSRNQAEEDADDLPSREGVPDGQGTRVEISMTINRSLSGSVCAGQN